jgi:hypothetical protein
MPSSPGIWTSKHEIRLQVLNQFDGFQPIGRSGDHLDVEKLFQVEGKFFGREFFIIDQNSGDHGLRDRGGRAIKHKMLVYYVSLESPRQARRESKP